MKITTTKTTVKNNNAYISNDSRLKWSLNSMEIFQNKNKLSIYAMLNIIEKKALLAITRCIIEALGIVSMLKNVFFPLMF